MDSIIADAMAAIEEFFASLFRDILTGRLTSMFEFVDDASSAIGEEVAKTPADWNSTIFTTLESISQTVILPIGTMIITALLCYEIITMVINQNHMGRDGETTFFFIVVFKAMVAIYFLAHSWEIAMAIFDVGSSVVGQVVSGYITPDASSIGVWGVEAFQDEINAMGLGDLILASFEAILINTALSILSVLILIILYGRMMEIYMYVSIAPIPFATFVNKEWGTVGTNYVKTLSSLAFQAFFIIICVAIFNALVESIATTTLVKGMWDVLLYTGLLAAMLFKSGTIARSIFGAH